jgi:CRISPR-associated exonuclease Cas4
MKNTQRFYDIEMLNVTTVIEHVFCPKFTYYGCVLGLNQYEEKRGTVIAGRKLHSKHEKSNLSYLPKNIIGRKLVALLLYSKKYLFVGKVDEAIETSDETILIERKYSNNHIIGGTMKTQLGLLSILLEENLDKPVNKAFVIFSKEGRYIVEFQIDSKIKKFALDMLHDTKNVIVNGISPYAKFDNRCLNCCYRKICPVGSLNTTR